MPDTETCERQESRVQYSFSLASNLTPLQAGAVTMTNSREVQTIWCQTLWSKRSNSIPLFSPLNAMHNPVVWNRFLWSKFMSATCNNKEKKKKKRRNMYHPRDYCRIAQSIRPMVLVSNRLSYRSASRRDHQGEKMDRVYCDQIRTVLRFNRI